MPSSDQKSSQATLLPLRRFSRPDRSLLTTRIVQKLWYSTQASILSGIRRDVC